MNKLEQLLERFDSLYGDFFGDYLCCAGKDCNCNGETMNDSLKQFLTEAIAEVLEDVVPEGKVNKDNKIEIMAWNAAVGEIRERASQWLNNKE